MRIVFVCLALALSLISFSQNLSGDITSRPTDPDPAAVISGKVLTSDNQPAPYVNIELEGGRITLTNERGEFQFRNLDEGSYILKTSMVGLQSTSQKVEIKKGIATYLTIVLTETAKTLNNVVIRTIKSGNSHPVSIGKIEIHPMDLPQSIAVVGQGMIRDQQAARLSDVIRNVNGVYLSTTRGSTQESFSARGYNFSSSNLFKNGTRINTGAMPEVSSLEKVEVLKGSAAILFGNVAPGGIVNMVTKQPRFYFGGEVSMRAGSFNLLKPTVDIYGPATSFLAYRINGSYEITESYRDVVRSKRYYFNPSLLFKLGKRTELTVQGDHLHHRFTPDFGIGSLNNTVISPLSRSTYLGTPWAYTTTIQSTASASLRHQWNERWKLTVNSSYQHYNRDYYSTERIQAAADGTWARPLGRNTTDENYYVAGADLNGKFKTGKLEHNLLSGVDADRYFTTAYTYNQPAIYDTINILDPNAGTSRLDQPSASKIKMVETPVIRFGAYIQDLLSLSEKIKLLLGLRWSYQEGRPALTTDLITKVKTNGILSINKAFSPRLGLVYRPVKTTSLFISYATSFSVNTGTDVYGNVLDPSIIDQYEAGIKNEFLGGKLSANLTFYRIKNNNLAQTAPFGPDGVTPNNNTSFKELTGETTSDGAELDIVSHLIGGLDITAGYSYNYMRYTKTPDARGNYIEGERLVNTPAHTANTSVFYTFSSKGLKGLKLGAMVFYTGNRYGGWNNTIGQTQNYSRLIEVDGFTTIDFSAGYSYRKLSLMARVSNLTNTFNYYVHENYSINPLPPRAVSATLSYKF